MAGSSGNNVPGQDNNPIEQVGQVEQAEQAEQIEQIEGVEQIQQAQMLDGALTSNDGATNSGNANEDSVSWTIGEMIYIPAEPFPGGEDSVAVESVPFTIAGAEYSLPLAGELTVSGTFTPQHLLATFSEDEATGTTDGGSWNFSPSQVVGDFVEAVDQLNDDANAIWSALSNFVSSLLTHALAPSSSSQDQDGRWNPPLNTGRTGAFGSPSPLRVTGPRTSPPYVGPLPPGWGGVTGNPWPHEWVGPDLSGDAFDDTYSHKFVNGIQVTPSPTLDVGSGSAKVNEAIGDPDNWEPVSWQLREWDALVETVYETVLQYAYPDPSSIQVLCAPALGGLPNLTPNLGSLADQLFKSRSPLEYWSSLTGPQLNFAGQSFSAFSESIQSSLTSLSESALDLGTFLEGIYPINTLSGNFVFPPSPLEWIHVPSSMRTQIAEALSAALEGCVAPVMGQVQAMFMAGFPGVGLVSQLKAALRDVAQPYLQVTDEVLGELLAQPANNSFLVWGSMLLSLVPGALNPEQVVLRLSDHLTNEDARPWILDSMGFLITGFAIPFSLSAPNPFGIPSVIDFTVRRIVMKLLPLWDEVRDEVKAFIDMLLASGLIPDPVAFATTLASGLGGALGMILNPQLPQWQLQPPPPAYNYPVPPLPDFPRPRWP